jgi:hypothetical protein
LTGFSSGTVSPIAAFRASSRSLGNILALCSRLTSLCSTFSRLCSTFSRLCSTFPRCCSTFSICCSQFSWSTIFPRFCSELFSAFGSMLSSVNGSVEMGASSIWTGARSSSSGAPLSSFSKSWSAGVMDSSSRTLSSGNFDSSGFWKTDYFKYHQNGENIMVLN